jgi:hypothetical protein
MGMGKKPTFKGNIATIQGLEKDLQKETPKNSDAGLCKIMRAMICSFLNHG